MFRNPSLQFATFSITEKGYALHRPDGSLVGPAAADFENGPGETLHAVGTVASLLFERFKAGELPIALVSTDNFSENGARLAAAVFEVVDAWKAKGFVDEAFAAYVHDEHKVAFPWSMVDRITPVPSQKVADQLTAIGVEGADVDTAPRKKGGPLAVFSNTEEVHYLVIEDVFPNGRPPLDKGGILLTDRDTVNKADRMKVTTCLNPLHTAMAVYGSILGYTSIAQESQNPDIRALIEGIGYTEGLPKVVDPGIISPKQFLDEVANRRIPNPGIPDTPQRIATDTSQKVSIRFGETIKSYAADGEGAKLKFIPLAIAGWVRYLLALDDDGKPFTPSPDPLADYLKEFVKDIKLGDPDSVGDALHPLLSNAEIFGIDLYAAGVGEPVAGFVRQLVAGPGAVKATLHRVVNA